MSAATMSQTTETGVWWDEFGQPHCPTCDQTLRHEERTNTVTSTNHHNDVYSCTDCGEVLISG